MPESVDEQALFHEAIEKAVHFFQAGDLNFAEEILRYLLDADPDNKDGIQILGLVYHKKHEYEKALELFNRAVELDPECADNFNNLALAQSCTGDLDGAIVSLRKAVEMTHPVLEKPKCAQFRSNLAIQLRQFGNLDEAELLLLEALEFSDGKDVTVWQNLGAIYGEKRDLPNATRAFEKAVELDPSNATAHVDLAYSYHLAGRWAEGWSEYEHRYESFPQLYLYNLRYPKETRWKRGDDLDGKTLLLFCEQGLGDALHFARDVRLVKYFHPDCKIVLQCSPTIAGLLEKSGLGIDKFYTEPAFSVGSLFEPPPHDTHASLLSVRHIIGLDEAKEKGVANVNVVWDEANINSGKPYLKTDAEADLGEKKEFRIGICWAGSPQHPNDSRRSLHLKHFLGVHDIPGVKLYSFQQDKRPRAYRYNKTQIDFCDGSDGMKITDLGEFMADFDQSAALLKEMNLVITVDTALMHLAAGLGIETWGLIPYNPDWRWGLEGEKTEWYDSLTLFRQETLNDWSVPFQKILERLETKIA